MPTLGRAEATDLYRAGLRAFDFGYWREALVFFTAAAREQPPQGKSVREYGMWQTPYLPYYYQGLSLYHLDRIAPALEAFAQSERLGAIKKRSSKKHYKNLVEVRQEMRRAMARRIQQTYRSAASDYAMAERLEQSPTLADSDLPSRIPDYEMIDASLKKTTANLQDASLSAAAAELDKALRLLDQAQDGIAEMALEIERHQRQVRAEEQRAAAARQRRKALADYRLAATLLSPGDCRPQAIELLENLTIEGSLAEPMTAIEGSSTEILTPDLLLARAHLLCDHFSLAELYLTGAVENASNLQQQLDSLRRELDRRRQRAWRIARYEKAARGVASRDCQHSTIEALEAVAAGAAGALETTPSLLLAEAHWHCGEPDAALAMLNRARETEVSRPGDTADRITALAAALASVRNPAAAESKRQELLHQYRLAVGQILSGACDRRGLGLIRRLVLGRGLVDLERQGIEVSGRATAYRHLARGYLQCGDLESAALMLQATEAATAAASETATLQQELQRRRRALAERLDQERALSDYLQALVLTALGGCRGDEIRNLIDRAQKVLGKASDTLPDTAGLGSASPADSLPIPYQPHLVMARAYSHCTDRDRVEEFLQLASGSGKASTADVRELESWLTQHPRLEPYTDSFALLVGAFDYSHAEGWPSLYKPGEDIREVRAMLETHGFEVESLENPTGRELEETLKTFFLEHNNASSQRLVFYYAGHGHTEITRHGIKLGYLVPVDARDPKASSSHLEGLFGMERFREYAIRSDANDILFMFDSCFAGTVFKATKSCVRPNCAPPDFSTVSLAELVARPVRMFLTAGDEEERVPDQSLFRRMVTRALAGEADENIDGFILGQELGAFVHNGVIATQNRAAARFKTAALGIDLAEPKWGTLLEGNFGQGDLLFHVPEAARKEAPRKPADQTSAAAADTELAYWSAARGSAEPSDYRLYLERFPAGSFAPLARWILQRLDSRTGP